MSFVRGSWAELLGPLISNRTGMSEAKMGQMDFYKNLQALQNQAAQQGLLGGLGSGQFLPFVNEQPLSYPTQAPKFLQSPHVEAIAKEFGFEYNYDCDSFTHKNGGAVSRRMIEDGYSLREIFSKAKTPNMSWLDDRINEVRVKLC